MKRKRADKRPRPENIIHGGVSRRKEKDKSFRDLLLKLLSGDVFSFWGLYETGAGNWMAR